MLLELCSDKSLQDVLKKRQRLLEIEVQCYVKQICRAVLHIHDKKVIHRDLKLSNILVKEIEVEGEKGLQMKITDFGLATKIEHFGELKQEFCGTPNYMAPEIVRK